MVLSKGRIIALLAGCAVCVVAFQGYLFVSRSAEDHTGPQITFDKQQIRVSVKDSETALLGGVTAWDDKDGDVTSSVVVEGVSDLTADHIAKVTYAAFDEAGNVTKTQREVVYSDYKSPKFKLSKPLVFQSGTSFDLFRCIHAEDALDGSLDSRIKATLVEGDTVVSAEGIHKVAFRVTNSMGETVNLTVPVEVYPAGQYQGTVSLRENLVYLSAGSTFEPMDYLQSYQVGETIYTFFDGTAGISVTVGGDQVDTSTPGVYSVSYTVTDGVNTGYTRLIVVVEA